MENSQKKSLKWLWIAIALVVVAAIGVWCGISASKAGDVFKFGTTFVMFAIVFIIVALGYLLGSIEIKGVSLGTAGVFLVAILIGWLCTLDFSNVPLLGAFQIDMLNPAED